MTTVVVFTQLLLLLIITSKPFQPPVFPLGMVVWAAILRRLKTPYGFHQLLIL